MKNSALVDLCFEILRDEVEAFSPDNILAMGGVAGAALSRAKLKEPFLSGTHPSYRKAGWYRGGAVENATDSTVSNLEARENYYCRLLFGSDRPPEAGARP